MVFPKECCSTNNKASTKPTRLRKEAGGNQISYPTLKPQKHTTKFTVQCTLDGQLSAAFFTVCLSKIQQKQQHKLAHEEQPKTATIRLISRGGIVFQVLEIFNLIVLPLLCVCFGVFCFRFVLFLACDPCWYAGAGPRGRSTGPGR